MLERTSRNRRKRRETRGVLFFHYIDEDSEQVPEGRIEQSHEKRAPIEHGLKVSGEFIVLLGEFSSMAHQNRRALYLHIRECR